MQLLDLPPIIVREKGKEGLSTRTRPQTSALSPRDLKRLVGRAKQGNIEAFQQLYGVYSRKILNYIFRLTGSRQEAEDLTQDTFVLAYKNLPSLKQNERFQSWLFRIAQNNVYQLYRNQKAPTTSLDEREDTEMPADQRMASTELNPEELMLSGELGEIVERVIRELPEKYKTVFIMSALHKLSYKEISEIVGRSLASVKSDIHRARVDVRDQVKRYLGR